MSLDFDNFDRRDCTIITKAVKSGDPKNVEKVISGLKELGEDITQSLYTTDRQGYTAIHHAVLQTNSSILQQLLQYADERCINTESHDRTTSLLLLCQQNDCSPDKEEMLAKLLAAKANPNLPERDPFSLPLLCVLEQKWWQAAEMLLKAGASPWLVDFEHSGWAPIYFALDNPDIMRLILDRGGREPRLLHQLMGNMLPPIPKTKMMGLYTLILPYCTEDLDVDLLLKASQEPYVDIVIDLLPVIQPCPDPTTARRSVVQFLRNMFYALVRLSPLDLRRFLAAYFTCLKNNVFEECDSDITMMPLLWSCRSVDSLKILLEEAERCDLSVAEWRMNFVDVLDFSQHLLEERSRCNYCVSREEASSYDILSVTAYIASSLDSFKSNLSVLQQAGFNPSMHTLATCIKHWVPGCTDHLLRASDIRLLAHLSHDCCATGTCWFREPFIIDTCMQLVLCKDPVVNHSSCVLALLYLGFNIHDITSRLKTASDDCALRPEMVQVLCLFDPCCSASSPCLATPASDRREQRCDQRNDPRSLKHQSRLALRSALGLCRIEEKLENLNSIVPGTVRDYVCFKQDFLDLM
ncbi:SOCS box domain [Trinorchestia longiramus]|nr:SOCS box domain [Trinorchestia longiramus]